MAQDKRIRCVRKSDRTNAHERIRLVGGTTPEGKPWKDTQEDAIRNINNRTCSYYVERPEGHRVDVIVGRSALGHEYLKTKSDGEQPNNLLSLPECP
ncbi:DUF3892 domain-containing protein [Sorangium sp. So ce1014]|uniref:DUF3892 domain-containing protein n=1 Tax=Sorangium sp. So ce1014 TaxID=3133326 RepID=UPI003F62568A